MNNEITKELHKINCLMADIDAAYHQASVKLGVSDSVLFIFYMLYVNNGSCSLNEIYKLSGISKQTVNSAVRKLENENLIYLENLDGKSKKVRATESGRSHIYEVAQKLHNAEVKTFSEWSSEEIRQFIDALEKYNALFKKNIQQL